MKEACIFFLLVFFHLNSIAQDEEYENERIQKGLKGGYDYVGLTTGYTPVENELLISIFSAKTVTDQVVLGRSISYNSNNLSGNEIMVGYFANVFLGKYQIKPVIGLKAELIYILERKFTNSLGLIERTPDYIGAKTSISPGVAYLINEDFNLSLFAQISYLPFTERDDILTLSILPRIEFAYSF